MLKSFKKSQFSIDVILQLKLKYVNFLVNFLVNFALIFEKYQLLQFLYVEYIKDFVFY